jgi:hypothetical protein
MLRCPLSATTVYSSLVLGLRDMRAAHGRDLETGGGNGDRSWIGLVIGMAVLDTLTGPSSQEVGRKWLNLLTSHGVELADAADIYSLRCSLLHGYCVPKLKNGRRMLLTPYQDAHAVDSSESGVVKVSVPVFCRCLVERIALEAKDDWDDTLIDTTILAAPPN